MTTSLNGGKVTVFQWIMLAELAEYNWRPMRLPEIFRTFLMAESISPIPSLILYFNSVPEPVRNGDLKNGLFYSALKGLILDLNTFDFMSFVI